MGQTEQGWLDQVRMRVLQGDFVSTESMLASALTEHPGSFELRRILSAVLRKTGRTQRAEQLLSDLLQEQPQDFPTAFTLAQIKIARAHSHAAAASLRTCFELGQHDPELAIRAIELLDEADRKADAAAIAERALADAQGDARLHAYAGMLELQLGDFDGARRHYLYALEHSPQACEWHAPHGLASAQRYADNTHPDFALFKSCLQRTDLSDKARSTLLFALGKAHDDVGDHESAAGYFRQANALAHALAQWSRKDWRRAIEARLAARQISGRTRTSNDFIPVFIVGVPRSGTTLLAELLGRLPRVRTRGELPWIAKLAQFPELMESPSCMALERAAAIYRTQTTQDDPGDAKWFIDKQPLNFRYVDLMLAIFPNAKVIYCQRSPRDTALSLWMQSFNEDVQGYANDFANIAIVMRDCARLMAHWQRSMAGSIRTISYEALVSDSGRAIGELGAWLDLPSTEARPPSTSRNPASISTASMWQARQPVFTHSIQRWRGYAHYVPELLRFAE